jgi:hypothetical protein
MKQIARHLSEAAIWLRETASRFSIRRDTAPIDSSERAFHFASTRAAFVSQKKLYGYLKERIGTRYPKMFEDEVFAESINLAKMQVFAAALSDTTVHVVAHVGAGGRLDGEARRAMARACYAAGLDDNAAQIGDRRQAEAWIAAFEERLDDALWENIAAGASAFTESPKALIRWAPIADELKRYDREIVENSIRFAWNEIIDDFRRRLAAEAAAADWLRRQSE